MINPQNPKAMNGKKEMTDQELEAYVKNLMNEAIAQGQFKVEIQPRVYRNKITGEFRTCINLMELGKYEECPFTYNELKARGVEIIEEIE